MQELLTPKESYKLREDKTKSSIKCKNCNKPMLFVHKTKCICPCCGNFIFRNANEEFKYRLKEKLNKMGK